MIQPSQALFIVLVVAICTFITRVLPFLFFGGNKEIPGAVHYLGKILPPAIMATLVIYCLKELDLSIAPYGAAEFISVAMVALLHLWKRNNLLSIGLGTLCYMVLIRVL